MSAATPTTPATPAMAMNPLQFLDDALQEMKRDGLYRKLRILEGEQKAHASFDGKDVINLSSNNYLGLTTHPRLREAALRAVKELPYDRRAVALYLASAGLLMGGGWAEASWPVVEELLH